MDKIRVPRLGVGRPRCLPDSVGADKAYSNSLIRSYLRRRGIRHVIPEKNDSKAARWHRGSDGGRPPGFDKTRCKARNTVERAINKIKQFRAVATRYDKRGQCGCPTTSTWPALSPSLAASSRTPPGTASRSSNQLRSLLYEYYPDALAAFESWKNGLCRPEARELLKAAPTQARAARLTRAGSARRSSAGRQRGIEAEAKGLCAVFRADWAHQPPLAEDELGQQTLAQLDTACTAADDLAQAVEETFPQHPDADIICCFPGLSIQLGARVLAEIGDDRERFADARSLKAYAGSSPITRASGKQSSITHR